MKEAELVGWIAVAVILTNQMLLTIGFISPAKGMKFFLGVNLLGAGLLLFTALLLQFMPFIVLEAVIIALNIYHFTKALFK